MSTLFASPFFCELCKIYCGVSFIGHGGQRKKPQSPPDFLRRTAADKTWAANQQPPKKPPGKLNRTSTQKSINIAADAVSENPSEPGGNSVEPRAIKKSPNSLSEQPQPQPRPSDTPYSSDNYMSLPRPRHHSINQEGLQAGQRYKQDSQQSLLPARNSVPESHFRVTMNIDVIGRIHQTLGATNLHIDGTKRVTAHVGGPYFE